MLLESCQKNIPNSFFSDAFSVQDQNNNRITVMMIVASLTQGLTTWVGDWDLGQELRRARGGRVSGASSAGGAVTSDQAGADFTRFQTLGSPDTGH